MGGNLSVIVLITVIALFCALYAAFGEAKPNLIFYILLLAAALNFLRHRTRTPLLIFTFPTVLQRAGETS